MRIPVPTKEEALAKLAQHGIVRIGEAHTAMSVDELNEIYDRRMPAWAEAEKKLATHVTPAVFPLSPLGVTMPIDASVPAISASVEDLAAENEKLRAELSALKSKDPAPEGSQTSAPHFEALLPTSKRGLEALTNEQLSAVLIARGVAVPEGATKAQLITLVLPE